MAASTAIADRWRAPCETTSSRTDVPLSGREPGGKELCDGVAILGGEVAVAFEEFREAASPAQRHAIDGIAEPGQLGTDETQRAAYRYVGVHGRQLGPHRGNLDAEPGEQRRLVAASDVKLLQARAE